MIIDAPLRSQIPELRQLWQEAFSDTEEFLDAFERTAFCEERCRHAMADGNVAAALYWFDCLHMGRRIAYLYAVATAVVCRGRGICHELMEDTHRHLAALGYEGSVVVPGSEELFRLYEGMGYRTCSTIREFSCTASEKEILLQPVDKTEYAKLRRKMLPKGGVVQEKENLDFLQTQAQFYAAPGVLLAARTEGDRLYGIELLGDETKAPEIVSALGCGQGTFRVPGGDTPFAMYRPLKEGALPGPAYFGLAFD